MKKFIYITSLVLFSAITFFATSCSKEEDKDKEGSIVFWYSEATATGLQTDGATTLTYYVDGQVVGSGATTVFWTGAPDCGQNGSVTVTKNLGNASNLSFTYSIQDQTGFEYFTGVANFTENTCTTIEMTY
jgi:hypothetical protein